MSVARLSIRPAVAADADALFAMADRLATSAVPVRSAFDASLQTILADPNQLLLAAAADGRSVGYLHGLVHPALHASGNNAWVDELGWTRTSGAAVSHGR